MIVVIVAARRPSYRTLVFGVSPYTKERTGEAMSLNDRFNRPGDSPLARLDHYLTNHADRLGQCWYHHTPWDRQALTQGLLALGAFAALERVLLLHDVLYLAVAFIAMQSFARSGVISIGRLQEEIQYEAAGLPSWTASAVNVLCLFTGLFSLATVLGYVLASAVDRVIPPPAMLDPLLSGLAFSGWKVGEYIARTNPTGPSGTPRRVEM